MSTRFGKELRKIRIDHEDNLIGMAKKLGVSVSYVSAVEAGGKDIPSEWPAKIIDTYHLPPEAAARLWDAFDECAKAIRVNTLEWTASQRKASSMFFRKIRGMSDAECEEMIRRLDGKEN